MRRIAFVATGLLLSVAFVPQISYAEGNVLLPSSGASSSSTPNLGLSPAAPSAYSSTATPPAPPVMAAPATDTSSSTSASTSAPPFGRGNGSDDKKMASHPQIKPSDLINSPVSASVAAHLPPGTIPTTIIHQPPDADVLAQAGKDLPYSLAVIIGEKSIFGDQDLKTISNKLGLKRDQVSSACTLSPRGIVQTDKGAYILAGDGSPHSSTRYDGTIKNYIMSAQASCAASIGSLPPGSGFITQIGDQYIVPLQQIHCPVPNRQVTSLTVTYDGSNKSQCAYE